MINKRFFLLTYLCLFFSTNWVYSQRLEKGKYVHISIDTLYSWIANRVKFNLNEFDNYCVDCQYNILDGDTVNYRDKNNKSQGLWVRFCSDYGKFGFPECSFGEGYCTECQFMVENNVYRNDTLVERYLYGFKNKKKTEIFKYEKRDSLKDMTYIERVLIKYPEYIEKGFYGAKSWKDENGKWHDNHGRQGEVNKYYKKSGKLYEKAYYKNNQIIDSAFQYYESGAILSESYFDTVKNTIFMRTFRDDGTKYSEVFVKDSKIQYKNCFDSTGTKIISCDPSKTLIGEPKNPKGEIIINDVGGVNMNIYE